MQSPGHVLIVGCGVFGLSTGLSLSTRYPDSKITLVDRFEPPVPDGTSVDTTRVIRADYHDPVYSELALESQKLIQNDPDLSRYYYQSGMIYAHAGAGCYGSRIWEKEYSAAKSLQEKRLRAGEFSSEYIKHLPSHNALFTRVNGDGQRPSALEGKVWNEGYLNEDVAFVNAEECMRAFYNKCKRQLNISFCFGSVQRVIVENGAAKGVALENGDKLVADLVILATGAWSNTLLDLRSQITATGHEVAWLKLTPQMEERYKNMPITTNFTTGFNIFPPLNGELKCLRRSPGYTNTRTAVDPVTGKKYETSCPPEFPSAIPADAEQALRANLAEMLPPHPEIANLVIATGGSAHGWKFLMVLGDKVRDLLEGELAPELQQRWKFKSPQDVGQNMEGAPRAQGVRQELKYCKPIAVIGAGVFGLTSALHLARSGYKDVTIFDYQEYDKNGYSVREGCDAASADENKILRASYGERKMYQDLAFQAMEVWQDWNEQVKTSAILPPNVSNTDRLWINSGFLRLSDTGLDEHEHITQENFPAEIRHTQYHIIDSQRITDAVEDGISATKFDPFDRRARGLPIDGMFDGTGGYVLASKACSWALHLCKQSGVKLRLGPSHRFTACNYSPSGSVTGVITADGVRHSASLVIVACGGWTPSLVPESDTIIEATAGSVLTVRLPKDRKDLWEKFDPKNFPVWSWKMSSYTKNTNRTSVGGLYGFPCTPDGIMKFGFRGAKWTNYTHVRADDGRLVSYPKTGGKEVPEPAMEVVQKFCEVNLPELVQLPIEKGRLCWYTDSTDNEFLIDFVPGRKGVMVATGGSGHGFKFLPVLGMKVVDIVEGKDTEFTRAFSWRQRPAGSANGLEEGPNGWRTLDKQKMISQWKAKL